MSERFGLSGAERFTMLSGIAHDPIQRDSESSFVSEGLMVSRLTMVFCVVSLYTFVLGRRAACSYVG
jgi:hypothetical protein